MQSTHLRDLFLFLAFVLTWRQEGSFRKDGHVFKTLFSYIQTVPGSEMCPLL